MGVKDYSQNGEQAHILHILGTVGIAKGHLIDMGAGDGYQMSNVRALLDMGWTGNLYDGEPRGSTEVEQAWITKEAPILPPCDMLNIDLDGNDWHVLYETLKRYRDQELPTPSLIVAEINPIFERHEAKVMPYNSKHVWKGDTYYGASLAAFEWLADKFGYVACRVHAGINVFLLRKDHAVDHPELVVPLEYRVKHDHKRHDPSLPWTTLN